MAELRQATEKGGQGETPTRPSQGERFYRYASRIS